jgi:hypothetical protein
MKSSTIYEWLSSGGLAFTLMLIAQAAAVITANGMWRGEQPVSSAPQPDAVLDLGVRRRVRAWDQSLSAGF